MSIAKRKTVMERVFDALAKDGVKQSRLYTNDPPRNAPETARSREVRDALERAIHATEQNAKKQSTV